MDLKEAVNFVNTYNRPMAKPLLEVVSCGICGNQFASQIQDVALARRRGFTRICSDADCLREARRRRQRGARVKMTELAPGTSVTLKGDVRKMGVIVAPPDSVSVELGRTWVDFGHGAEQIEIARIELSED
jgi:hypothetical protein